ncbi:MAG: sensor histidine kinase [Betaproteobacteria bacterium]|nr:sensor histidine kinase [Betaproteobacteria bacterium]
MRTPRLHAFLERHRRWLLLGQLALLYLIFEQEPAGGAASLLGRMLFIGQAGLFLLWQPLIHGQRQLALREVILTVAAVTAMVLWLNVWLLAMWTMLMASIIGGRVFLAEARWTRLFYLLALGYLVAALLLLVTPQGMPPALHPPAGVGLVTTWALPAALVLMALLPGEDGDHTGREAIDFFFSVFLFLLLAVLVLGSIAFVLLLGQGYVESLILTLLSLAGVLLVLGWAWRPRLGFSGIGTLVTRYVMSFGVPFERSLAQIAEASLQEQGAEGFLRRAQGAIAALPWVRGGEWEAGGASGSFGKAGGVGAEFLGQGLRMVLYSGEPLSPALVWHVKLLVQILGELHLAKLRGEQLQQMSYVQAVHETGARLTHDVKNLLQSLNMLCFAAGQEGEDASPRFQAMLRRQLPVITQRLHLTLEKLRRPGDEPVAWSAVGPWWDEWRRRYAFPGVEFEDADVNREAQAPVGLLASVADNLMHNALGKQPGMAPPRIRVSLQTHPRLRLAVCDDGAPVPPEVLPRLFHGPVPSESGLGIGLLQAARLAESEGLRLRLAANEPGRVCIELVREASGV